jgi:hypothetical protein
MEVSATQVATIDQSLIDRFLIDEADSGEVDTIRSLGIDTRLAPAVMRTVADKVALAQIVRDWLAE